MRGCLAVLALAAAFSVAAVWVAGPPMAAGVVSIGLGLAGFAADRTEVTVAADPPLVLLSGRADEIRITASNATIGGLTATAVDVVLVDVGIVDRTAASVSGSLAGVVVGATDERLAVSSIEFDGAGDEADAVARVPAGALEILAARAFETSTGIVPDAVDLVAPNVLALTVGGIGAQARLGVDGAGSVVALGAPGAGGPVVLVGAASATPFEIESVAVEDGEVVVRGTLDIAALLR